MSQPGTFFAICGPSGAGKDTVLRHLRAALDPRADVLFARRVITRPTGADEDNESVTPEEFARRRRAGDFLLQWQAHGLDYGLPVNLLEAMRAGRSVIANLSRGSLAEARRTGIRVVAIEISAAPDVLAARLASRAREDDAARQDRLARNALYAGGVEVDHVILNDGAPELAAAQLMKLILEATPCPAA